MQYFAVFKQQSFFVRKAQSLSRGKPTGGGKEMEERRGGGVKPYRESRVGVHGRSHVLLGVAAGGVGGRGEPPGDGHAAMHGPVQLHGQGVGVAIGVDHGGCALHHGQGALGEYPGLLHGHVGVEREGQGDAGARGEGAHPRVPELGWGHGKGAGACMQGWWIGSRLLEW